MSQGTRGRQEHGLRKATLRLGEQRLVNAHGEFDVHFFRDLAEDTTAMAISCGQIDLGAPLLARVHSSCVTSECLMGRDCDCSEQLQGALATIANEGRGVVYYLIQEGRGAGLTAKARDRMMVQASGNRITTFEAYASMGLPADLRRYDVVAPMSRLLGVRAPIQLLTNNPEKAAAVAEALAVEKIEVCGTESIQGPSSRFNRDYLTAKHDSGHALDEPERRAGALPPRPVRVFEPTALPGDPHKVVTASYFLPIELPVEASPNLVSEVDWFRLSVVYDRETERESILLTSDESADPTLDESGSVPTSLSVSTSHPVPTSHPVSTSDPLTPSLSGADPDEFRVTMRLFDRLPGPDSVGREALSRALIELREGDRGAIVVGFDDRDHAES